MFIKKIQVKSLWTSLVMCMAMSCSAQSAASGIAWNNSPDPNALYGFCSPGGSGLGSKPGVLFGIGETLTNVLAVTVLDCRPFTGGGTAKVNCPAGSPYAYCTSTGNDGLGNKIELGILKLDATTNPTGLYTGCPGGAQLKSKLRLATLGKAGPRRIKGIVTLACGPATQPSLTNPTVVNCPAGPNPYGTCLSTPNDGFGNAVTIGVVTVREAGDPYDLYGQCNTQYPSFGIQPGFKSKSTLVTAVGRSLANVRSIDILTCNAPAGFGSGWPSNLNAGSCSLVSPSFTSRYDYCIWGTDSKGNGVLAGVNNN